jgi:hypothetical protein
MYGWGLAFMMTSCCYIAMVHLPAEIEAIRPDLSFKSSFNI